MAAVRSLGLHQPSALPYLVAESILPPDASEDSFTWRCYDVQDENGASTQEEIIFTAACVVWSRGGVVKRCYKFDMEKEKIVDAIFAHFTNSKKSSLGDTKQSQPAGSYCAYSNADGSAGLPNGKKRKQVTIQTEKRFQRIPGLSCPDPNAREALSKALVVVLKSQAHIFYLSGDSHIVPLPFEVESAWATPNGLLFQRKVSEDVPPPPPVPLNPAISSRTTRPTSRLSESFTVSDGNGPPHSSVFSTSQPSKLSKKKAPAPTIFSLREPHSEMGLLAISKSTRDRRSSESLGPLNPAEMILYVSSSSEIPFGDSALSNEPAEPLILLVTINTKSGGYSVRTARYRPTTQATAQSQRRKSSSGIHSKRRSSYFDAGGTTTPVSHGASALRESFGPGQNRSVSHTFNASTTFEKTPSDVDDLASQLGQEFGDVGASWKASRRVSSLLARSDLVANQDRATFPELAGVDRSKSGLGPGRRGDSFGGGSNRLSLGFHPRSSLPGNASVYSNSSSFLDAPVDKLLESLNNGGDFEGFESMGIREAVSGLPQELILTGLASVPSAIGNETARRRIQDFKIFTLTSFHDAGPTGPGEIPMLVCLFNRGTMLQTLVDLWVRKADSSQQTKKDGSSRSQFTVTSGSFVHRSGVIDCSKVVDGSISRMLVLSQTTSGRGELTLEAPWSTPIKIELPGNMILHQPYAISSLAASWKHRDEGLKRIIKSTSIQIRGLDYPENGGKINVVDARKGRHRLRIQLQPQNPLVKRILDTCRFMLPFVGKAGDGILLGWWEACKWLRTRGTDENDVELTAVTIILFSMAVYFIEDKDTPPKTPKPKRKGRKLLRSSSGSHVDLTDWNSMVEKEAGSSGAVSPWMAGPAWGWINEDVVGSKNESLQHGQGSRSLASNALSNRPKNEYIIRCARLAREFISSPQGEAASGVGGYLPTAVSKGQYLRQAALGDVLVGLHLLREEMKLTVSNNDVFNSERGLLGPILAQIGGWLGWDSWSWRGDGYYAIESPGMDNWLFEDSRITGLDVTKEPFDPPSIFSFVETFMQGKDPSFRTIIAARGGSFQPGVGRDWGQAINLTPRTLALIGFLSELKKTSSASERVALLLRWGIDASVIDTLPDGIGTPLHEAILSCQSDPPMTWEAPLLELVGREDLLMSTTNNRLPLPISRPQPFQSHDAVRDVHQIGHSVIDGNTVNSFEVSAEADRLLVTKLIFRDDRRFFEAVKILNQMKPPAAECPSEPDWSESDLLEAQKELVQLVTLRTLSIPAGRAMIGFDGRVPLLTEKLPIPSFSLQCIMKPSNVTISADRSAFTEEKVCWAFFHNGVSTGLAMSKSAKGIDTSWILYNKPTELTNRHAGFLLALGLNGHLRSLAKWVAFKYLTPKHTMTSIGLLLGLSASYLGTMDPLITRLLSVHVTRMLPLGAAELNLSPLTQTTGIMGIGLLYCNSQHRRMSEVMLSEIENTEEEDDSAAQPQLRYEGYRLATGFALGFVNLAKGRDLRGLQDMRIVERLLALAVGAKDVDMVHVLDKATAGATVALAIIFLKSNDTSVAQKVDIPDTPVQFDYVRPDIFLLRTLARHLIMWDSIKPSSDWMQQSLPEFFRGKYKLSSVRRLTIDDMPYYNVIAGLCFALGLRFAGSGNHEARDILIAHLDQFIRICRLPALNYDGKLAQNSVRNCQDVVALSAAIVVAGTGDLVVFRRLRSLHGRVDGDTPYGSHMAAHMGIGLLFLGGGTYTLGTSDIAVASLLCSLYPIFPTDVLDNTCHLQAFRHLWVLAAEPRCLIPRDLDTRRVLTIPATLSLKTGEKRQISAPCLLPDLDSISTVKIEDPRHWNVTLDFAGNEALRNKFRFGNQAIYLQRRANYNAAGSSVFSSTLAALSDVQDIFASSTPDYTKALVILASSPGLIINTHGKSSHVSGAPSFVWDWIFGLDAFKHLDVPEKAAVIPQTHFHHSTKDYGQGMSSVSLPSWLRPTMVDARLVLDNTIRSLTAAAAGNGAGEDVIRDRLWQLRLLFAWSDGNTEEGDAEARPSSGGLGKLEGTWLKKDVIESARWKIWGIQAGDEGADHS